VRGSTADAKEYEFDTSDPHIGTTTEISTDKGNLKFWVKLK